MATQLDQYLAPQTQPSSDPLLDQLREEGQQRAVATVLQPTNPDKAGQANQIARRVGMPAATVERNLPTFQDRQRAQQWRDATAKYPQLVGWLEQPRNAAVAADDAPAIAKTAEAHRSWLSTAARDVGGLAYSGLMDLSRAVTGIASSGVDAARSLLNSMDEAGTTPDFLRAARVGFNVAAGQPIDRPTDILAPTAVGLSSFADFQKRLADAHAPSSQNPLVEGLYQGVRSVPTMLAAIGATAAGAPQAGVGIVAGQTYGQSYLDARAVGLSPAKALTYATSQGAIAAATQDIPLGKYLDEATLPFATRFVRTMAREQVANQVANLAQSFDQWAAIDANRGKSFSDYLSELPAQAVQTAAMSAVGSGVAMAGVEGGRLLADRVARRNAAKADAAGLDGIMDAAAASKMRQRDPDAFASLMRSLGGDSSPNVYLPGEAVRSYLQSDGEYDRGFWDRYSDQIDESRATGGDIVIPLDDVVAHLAGSKAWDALREDARLTPGGMSLREANAFENDLPDHVSRLAEEGDRQHEAAKKETSARQQVEQSAYSKLTNAGFTPDVARTYATLVGARAATRAARLGVDLTGHEYDNVEINQVLPEALAPLVGADNLDVAINAMRKSAAGTADHGPSLLEWISRQGGIEDRGGDIASMGGNDWHREKPFRRRLIRETDVDHPSMLGEDGQTNTNSPDELALRAHEAGYFPQYAERPDVPTFLSAIGDELRGTPRYAKEPEGSETERTRQAGEDLRQLLEQEGLDPDKASRREIARAVERYQQAAAGGDRSFGQGEVDAATPERPAATLDEARSAAQTFVGARLHNEASGLDATVSNATLRKMTSQSAVRKSTSPEDHALAVANVDKLFAHALLDTSAADERGEPTIAAIRRYVAPMVTADGEVVAVKMTVKETTGARSPNPLYTVETIEVDDAGKVKPARMAPPEGGIERAPGRDRNAPQAGFNPNVEAAIAKVKSALKPKSFNSGKRGRVTFMGSKALVDLFETRDLSTFIHESAHMWLEEFRSDAEQPDAPAQIKRDWKTISDWFAANGHAIGEGGKSASDVLRDNASPIRLGDFIKDATPEQRGLLISPDGKLYLLRDGYEHSDFGADVRPSEAAKFAAITTFGGEIALRRAAQPSQAQDRIVEQIQRMAAREGRAVTEGGLSGDVGVAYPVAGSRSQEIPVEAHELWARGVERFVMEGKAPSSVLRRAFDTFRSWLLTIYHVVDNLRSPISPEVRDVMGRLLATDEEIAAASAEQRVWALFTDAKQAGMTDAEFKAYQEAVNGARDEANDALLFRTMASVRAARTKEYRERRDAVRQELVESAREQPVWRAMAALQDRTNGVRLDKQAIIDTYGADALDLLPKSVPPIYADRGISPDELAELSGFATGDDMVKALMGVEQRRRALREAGDKRSAFNSEMDRAADEIMRDRYGDPLNDGSIEREARELIHNDRQGEVIASELRALGRRNGKPATPYALAKRWAERKIAEGTVADVVSRSAIQQYERAAAKAGREAEAAMRRGDTDEVFRQKQAQMLNNALVSEARKAADAVDAAVSRMAKIAKKRTMKTVDQDYLERAQALLEQVELKTRSQVSITRQGKFEAWAREQEANGIDVVVPPSFEASLGTTNWSRLSVEKLLGLDDAVSQIMHLGRLKQTLLDGAEEREFNAVVGEAVDGARKLPPKAPHDLTDPSFTDRLKSGVAAIDASLLKMETVFDWLDGGDSNGVFNRVAFRPIAEAQDRERDMLTDYYGRVREAMGTIPKERLRRWQDRITVPELIDRATGRSAVMNRHKLIAIALNMGNEGNIQRLTDGYGWNEQAVRDVLARELSAEEWRFVQNIWDIFETLWPQISEMERRVNGVEPDKVEATPLSTIAGTLRGGYYPAIYDSTRSLDAERNQGKASDLFETLYTRATTRASATRERVEKVQRPILLDVGVINRHLGEVIHDITHREAVINADRFLLNHDVSNAVDQALGREIRQQFRPWLRFVANSWATERAGNEGLGKFLNKARTNATVVGMGFRISTIMTQIAGYSNSFEVVGERWIAPAIARTAAHPIETFNFVMSKSGEIRHRMDTLDRDIRLSINQLAGRLDPLTAAKRFAFHGIGYADRVVAIPTWLGAYNKALAAGMSEQDAIYAGDKAVRVSQGAGSAKDLAAVQRGTGKWGELLKISTMFYSYFSAVYQRERTLGRDVATAVRERRPGMSPRLLARALWLLAVPPVLTELMAGRGPGEDENWEWWAFTKMLVNTLGPIPFARDLIEPTWDALTGKKGFDFELSPLQRSGQSIVVAAKDAHRVATGQPTNHATKDTLEAAGYATGLVPGQLASAMQFLVDVGDGDQDPHTVAEWYRGLTTGHAEPPSH